jgi:hypothetical protein
MHREGSANRGRRPRVRYLKRDEALRIEGMEAFSRIDREVFFGPLEVLAPASVAAIRRELVRYWESEGWVFGSDHGRARSYVDMITWSDESASTFDDDRSLASPCEIVLTHDKGIALDVTVYGVDVTRIGAADMTAIIEPLLTRRRARLESIELGDTEPGPSWELRIRPSIRNRTVAEIAALGDDVIALAAAAASGDVNRETALDLLRSGRAELLVGQPESDWLEAKSVAYDLGTDRAKIELAQDVARFANSERGGLIIVGAKAKRWSDGERIVGLNPLKVAPSSQRYHGVIDHRVHPPIEGLEVIAVSIRAMAGGHLLVVHVPPQPEELKPFLVHGAIVAGRVEGAFISIVRRRGEQSIPIEASAIHAQLAAGRALLRGEQKRPAKARRS